MFTKDMKARKEYTCDHCLRKIHKGEIYTFGKTRGPMYSEDVMGNDVQTGIEYQQWRLCIRDDCDTYPNEKWDG